MRPKGTMSICGPHHRVRRAPLASVALALGILAGAGCYAPTLPLPPPVALSSAPDAMGIATVTGRARPDAYVLCLNNATDAGVIGRADAAGDFSVRLPASVGDSLSVWQMEGSDSSPFTEVIVPAPP
jgi:hypothetical protein